MSKPTYKDLFALHSKYIEYVLAKTLFIHQYAKNISQSGGEIESEVRRLFRAILPKRFHVTHGYIIKAPNPQSEPTISPQIDMIVVDTLVPHSLFTIDEENGMEIVPVEAVVGIFEVKREINAESLVGSKDRKGAFAHITEIVNQLEIDKTNTKRYLPGGILLGDMITGGYHANPMIGIIGTSHDNALTEKDSKNLDKTRFESSEEKARQIQNQGQLLPIFDVVLSLSGLFCGLENSNDSNGVNVYTVREPNRSYNYKYIDPSIAGFSSTKVVAISLGYVLMYIQNVVGTQCDLNNYFFNKNI